MGPITKRIYEKVLAGEPLNERLRARLLGIIATSDDWQDQLNAANDARDVARFEAGNAYEALAESVRINDECRLLIGHLRGKVVELETELAEFYPEPAPLPEFTPEEWGRLRAWIERDPAEELQELCDRAEAFGRALGEEVNRRQNEAILNALQRG